MRVQSVRMPQHVVVMGRVWISIVLAVAIQAICVGDAPPKVTATLRRGENVGVGFDKLARAHFFAPEGGELEIELNPPAGLWIIDPPDPPKATPADQSGRIIWLLTVCPVEPPTAPAASTKHAWLGVGYVANAGAWVRFDGELLPPPGEGPQSDYRYRASVVDIDIDMDAKEVRSDVNWPPEGDLIEDEKKTDPGMRLPKSLVAGQGFPGTTAGTEYKIMNLTLRTAWAGHPDKDKDAPSVLGQVEFTLDGSGVAVYGSDNQFLFDFLSETKDRTFDITVPQLTEMPLRVLTNDRFDGPRSLHAKFTWMSTLQGNSQRKTAVDEIRLVPYDADRNILGPRYVPGLSRYPYRLELLPGEQLDPGTVVTWTVDKPTNAIVPEGADGMDVEVEFCNHSAEWITLTAAFVVNGNNLSASKTIGLVRVYLREGMSDAGGAPFERLPSPTMPASGKPPTGAAPTFTMESPPGSDWSAFTTNLVSEEPQVHRQVNSGGAAPETAAFVARADVDLVAPEPSDSDPAHHHIEVGFVQYSALSVGSAMYNTNPPGGGRSSIYPIEAYAPFGTLDWIAYPDVKRSTERWPWYALPTAYTTGEGNNTTFQARLDALDSPSLAYPSFFNLFHEGFKEHGEEDPNSHRLLNSFQADESFTIFVGVRTTDTQLNAHTRVFDVSGWKKWKVEFDYPVTGGPLVKFVEGQWSSPGEPTQLPNLAVVPSVTAKNRYKRQIVVQPAAQE